MELRSVEPTFASTFSVPLGMLSSTISHALSLSGNPKSHMFQELIPWATLTTSEAVELSRAFHYAARVHVCALIVVRLLAEGAELQLKMTIWFPILHVELAENALDLILWDIEVAVLLIGGLGVHGLGPVVWAVPWPRVLALKVTRVAKVVSWAVTRRRSALIVAILSSLICALSSKLFGPISGFYPLLATLLVCHSS